MATRTARSRIEAAARTIGRPLLPEPLVEPTASVAGGVTRGADVSARTLPDGDELALGGTDSLWTGWLWLALTLGLAEALALALAEALAEALALALAEALALVEALALALGDADSLSTGAEALGDSHASSSLSWSPPC